MADVTRILIHSFIMLWRCSHTVVYKICMTIEHETNAIFFKIIFLLVNTGQEYEGTAPHTHTHTHTPTEKDRGKVRMRVRKGERGTLGEGGKEGERWKGRRERRREGGEGERERERESYGPVCQWYRITHKTWHPTGCG